MSDLQRGERLQLMLNPEELRALDDWRFSRRMPSRASAIRELLRRGLAAEGFASALGGNRSEEFGVITSAPRNDGDRSAAVAPAKGKGRAREGG